MTTNTYYNQENHGPYEEYALGEFKLEESGLIPNLFLAYKTFGELNKDKTNAILIPTWYTGTSKGMEAYVGEGRALDPSKYFIIIINQIGNGLSSSPQNSEAPINQGNFPKVRIGDDVRAQKQFIQEKFGINELALVVGGSMGAQQTYEWAVRFPDMVKRAAPIAGTAKNTVHDFLYTETLNQAITSDPGFKDGFYQSNEEVKDGLTRQANLWAVMGFSTEFYAQEKWRDFGLDSVQSFLDDFLRPLFRSMDPNVLLTTAWKWQHGDVSRLTDGDLKSALARVTAKMFVMPIDEDMFFPPRDCEREQKMVANSELRMIHSSHGHLGLFGGEGEKYFNQVDRHLSELLSIEV